ncbi:MAG: glycoside hydrolase family 36 protein [Chitinophagaceae bacterium]
MHINDRLHLPMDHYRRMICLLITILSFANVKGQKIEYKIEKDGSFDIMGSAVTIANCYPAIDNKMLKPLKLSITKTNNTASVKYYLIEGMVELSFSYQGNALVIKPSVKNNNQPAYFISILREAEVKNVSKIYRSPTQIMGNGGIINWPASKMDYSSCGMLTGLLADSGASLVIATRDFNKYASYINIIPTERNGGKKLLEACVATEGLPPTSLPAFYFTQHRSAFTAMQNEAKAIATYMNVAADKKQSYHWCSWYYTYYHLTASMLTSYLKGFKSIQPEVPIQTIQIDAGYQPHAGDWLEPSEKFPKGIEPSIKEIISNNYKAGIWIGPYMVGNKSKVYLAHPDWILRYKDGSPIINMSFYGEERLWGAMDEEIYTFDTSNPEVMDYLRQVFRALKNMGISFFKTDFMLYGAEASNKVKRYTPGKTSIEYQREFFEMIRQEIGPDAFWLGCIAPFASMLGYADGMRISADITPQWEGGTSMFNESKGAQHINNIWWQNDPDAIILRSKYSNMNDAEARSLILWMGMLGGVVNTSDLFHEIPKERTALFRFLEPGNEKNTAIFPFLAKKEQLEVMVKKYDTKKAFGVLFTNRQEKVVTGIYPLNSIVEMDIGTCYNWDEKESSLIGKQTNITISLNPHESKLIYISADGAGPAGMTLGGKMF